MMSAQIVERYGRRLPLLCGIELQAASFHSLARLHSHSDGGV